MTDPAEFWAKVAISGVPDNCWEWRGATAGRVGERYGQLRWNGRHETAHRVAWMVTNGLIPVGLVLDHLCRNHLCVNPDHLEVVTNRENIMRGNSLPARNARKTHCIRGHSEWRTRVTGQRACVPCGKANDRKRYERIRLTERRAA